MFTRYIILICLIFIPMTTYSDNSEKILADLDEQKIEVQARQEGGGAVTKAEYRKIQEIHRFYLIAALIAVTPIFLIILLYFIGRSKEYTEHAIIHSSGLVLIIQATTIVVIAAPTTEQLTAAVGILAAIAGYLFGSAKVTRN